MFPNLYYDVGNPSLIPTIHQMLALSHVTNYRCTTGWLFSDSTWAKFPRIQLLIPGNDNSLGLRGYDLYAWIPWFAERLKEDRCHRSLHWDSSWGPAEPRRARELLTLNKRQILLAKVGEEESTRFQPCARQHRQSGRTAL